MKPIQKPLKTQKKLNFKAILLMGAALGLTFVLGMLATLQFLAKDSAKTIDLSKPEYGDVLSFCERAWEYGDVSYMAKDWICGKLEEDGFDFVSDFKKWYNKYLISENV